MPYLGIDVKGAASSRVSPDAEREGRRHLINLSEVGEQTEGPSYEGDLDFPR